MDFFVSQSSSKLFRLFKILAGKKFCFSQAGDKETNKRET